jgi:peptide/nickel transport system permease protein
MIMKRLPLSISIDLTIFAFVWIVSVPIGIYSAVRQYSFGDYVATVIGFIGLAVPNFLLALVIMWIGFSKFGVIVNGLNSNEFIGEPLSIAKFIDMTKHIWVIIVVAGTGQMAGMIRILRANLLDELNKPYVETARVKGVPEFRMLLKYPVRMAFNPIISSIGYLLPAMISSSTITAIVLSVPTIAPLLYDSLLKQDVYVSGGIIMLLCLLTVVGTLISDILLYFVDPRVRFSSIHVEKVK